MSTKERQLFVGGLSPTANYDNLRAAFERFGEVQNCFAMAGKGGQTSGNGIVTFKQLANAQAAAKGMQRYRFEGRELRINFAQGKGKGKAASQQPEASASSSVVKNPDVEMAEPETRALAPAPKAIAPAPGQNPDDGPRDTWEVSLEDSDFDDGFVPPKERPKISPVIAKEWSEAYSLIKRFARDGGAILAVDVESHDIDHDMILEVGLAHVNWKAGNGVPPHVFAEHLIVEENERKRNGLYSPDARDRFAFGKSNFLKEDKVQIRLLTLIHKYSNHQPLILLFHNSVAEKAYFDIMNVQLGNNIGENRIPIKFLSRQWPKGEERGITLILDTQRLWQAYLMHNKMEVKGAPLKLGLICKRLGIKTEHLHNAGNDALYTLRLLMELMKVQAAEEQKARVPIAEEERMVE